MNTNVIMNMNTNTNEVDMALSSNSNTRVGTSQRVRKRICPSSRSLHSMQNIYKYIVEQVHNNCCEYIMKFIDNRFTFVFAAYYPTLITLPE